MAEALVNGVSSTLNGAITNVQTTITIATADIAKFPASPNQYRLAVTDGTNTELMLVTGGQGTATLTVTRHAESYGGASTSYAFASGSTVAQVLTVAGLQSLFAGGGTTASSVLGADVNCPTAGTYYDAVSLSLGAGTWLVTTTVQGFNNTGGLSIFTIKLWDGTNVFASSETFTRDGSQDYPLTASAVVTLATTTTVKVSGAWANNNGRIARLTASNGTPAGATQINAVLIPASSGGGLVHIATVTLSASAANITFSSIPGTYRHLKIDGITRGDVAGSTMTVMNAWLNGDTTLAHYSGSSNRAGITAQASGPFLRYQALVPNYADATSATKYLSGFSGRTDGTVEPDTVAWTGTSPAAVTQVQLLPASGNFVAGSIVSLYGLA